jgi:hypothetical protein
MSREAAETQTLNTDVSMDAYDSGAATEAAGPATLWEKLEEHILAFVGLEEDWDGAGAEKVRDELIRSALHLIRKLQADRLSPPHDAYPLPDGNIILEWQHHDGVIERIEVEGVGLGQLMVTYPDAPAEFTELRWLPAGPLYKTAITAIGLCHQEALNAATVRKEDSSDPSGFGNFELAA